MKKLILILIFLLVASPALAIEVFVLYEKPTGYIVTIGRVNSEWDAKNRDGSTISEFIEEQVAQGLAVVFLPGHKLPDHKKYKVVDGKIVELTKQDKAAIEAKKPKSKVDLLAERVQTLENAQ